MLRIKMGIVKSEVISLAFCTVNKLNSKAYLDVDI